MKQLVFVTRYEGAAYETVYVFTLSNWRRYLDQLEQLLGEGLTADGEYRLSTLRRIDGLFYRYGKRLKSDEDPTEQFLYELAEGGDSEHLASEIRRQIPRMRRWKGHEVK